MTGTETIRRFVPLYRVVSCSTSQLTKRFGSDNGDDPDVDDTESGTVILFVVELCIGCSRYLSASVQCVPLSREDLHQGPQVEEHRAAWSQKTQKPRKEF